MTNQPVDLIQPPDPKEFREAKLAVLVAIRDFQLVTGEPFSLWQIAPDDEKPKR